MSAIRKGQLRRWLPDALEVRSDLNLDEPILVIRSYIERGPMIPGLGPVHRSMRVWEVLDHGELLAFGHRYLSRATESIDEAR
jgi:hypothetical protein